MTEKELRRLQQYLPFTVLKPPVTSTARYPHFLVATVLTVYGIETFTTFLELVKAHIVKLQQYLPFTVLKLHTTSNHELMITQLQQYLPFTVLKLTIPPTEYEKYRGCNSTYRLRY